MTSAQTSERDRIPDDSRGGERSRLGAGARRCALLGFVGASILFSPTSRADEASPTPTSTQPVDSEQEQAVHLKNGSIIRGFVSTNAESVVIRTAGGLLTFNRSEVLRIEFVAQNPTEVLPTNSLPVPPNLTAEAPWRIKPYRVELRLGSHRYPSKELDDLGGPPQSTTGAIYLSDFNGPDVQGTFAALFLRTAHLGFGATVGAGYYQGSSSERVQYSNTAETHDLKLVNQYVAAGLRIDVFTSPRTYFLTGVALGAFSGELSDKVYNPTNGAQTCGDKWTTTSLHGSVGFGFRATDSVHLLLDVSGLSARVRVNDEVCSNVGPIGDGRIYEMGGSAVHAGIVYAFK